jgi:PAS domain S-box-containing protein
MHEEIALAGRLTIKEMQLHSSIIINAFDQFHKVVFWNNRCAAHFGISVEEAIGKKLEDILPWTKSDERLRFLDRAFMGTKFQILKVPFKLKSGHYVQTVFPVRDNGGKVIAVLNFVEEMNS